MLTCKGFIIIFKYFKNFSASNSNKHQYTYSTHKQYFLKKAHVLACSVMSDSLQLGGLNPSSLVCPWIFHAQILEWIATPFSRGLFLTQDQTRVSCIGR